jgi:predicted TIM-barrel fold metal-dependent hydrolase
MSTEAKPFRHPRVDEVWLAKLREEVLEPELPVIDPHHHLWERESGVYLVPDLQRDLASGHDVRATVYVQCGYGYRTDGPDELRVVGETETVVRLTSGARRGVCAGIVGHADFRLGDRVEDVLTAHVEAGKGRFRGIRQSAGWDPGVQLVTATPAPKGLLLDAAFRSGLGRLARFGLSYECSLYYPQLPEMLDLAQAFPDLPILVNHCAGFIGVGPHAEDPEGTFNRWRANLRELAECPNVSLKLGGLAMPIRGFTFHEQPLPPSSGELVAAWRPII